jgi:hypothetical protein
MFGFENPIVDVRDIESFGVEATIIVLATCPIPTNESPAGMC